MVTIEFVKAAVPAEYFDYTVNDAGIESAGGARLRVFEAGTRLRGELSDIAVRRLRGSDCQVFVEECNVGKPNPDRLFIQKGKFRVVPDASAGQA